MNNTRQPEHWYEKAAAIMVVEGCSLFAATDRLGLGIRNAECENIVRTKAFKKVLETERNKLYKELANDPSRNRTAAVGQLVFIINRMVELEQYDKAAKAIMDLAKLEGWTSEQTTLNIFNDLNAKDLAALRAKFQQLPKEKMN